MQEREILFRGKRVDNGEWVYGFYTFYGQSRGLHPAIITGTEEACVIPAFIDPETRGEYTGLTDKNGIRIFEGDIVKCSKKSAPLTINGIVENGRYTDVDSKNYYDYLGWHLKILGQRTSICTSILQAESDGIEFEVIGNIHDNPELLKE